MKTTVAANDMKKVNYINFKPGYQIPKKGNWIARNPRLFVISSVTASVLIFFSKPLYDVFYGEEVEYSDIRRKHNMKRMS